MQLLPTCQPLPGMVAAMGAAIHRMGPSVEDLRNGGRLEEPEVRHGNWPRKAAGDKVKPLLGRSREDVPKAAALPAIFG